jgi:hypothetical protein
MPFLSGSYALARKQNVKKYHLVKWVAFVHQKIGELGVTNLHLKNDSLLCKWIYRWTKIHGEGSFTQCRPNPTHSHF